MKKITQSLCVAAALTSGLLPAQSVTVTPANESVAVNGTRQYSTQVSGLANTAVTWSVTGAGSIDQTGLYLAPATPPAQNPVTIVATSVANPTIRGIAYANVLNAGPTITSISPNPVPAGTFTITISGSGIQAGATIICNGIQLTTTKVIPPASVSGTGYVGTTTSALGCAVKNPGTVYSNGLAVPVKTASSGGGSGGLVAPVVTPSSAVVVLGATQQFTAANAASWTATSGIVSSTGLYTAPASMPASGSDTVTATNASGSGSAKITLVSNVPPTIASIGSPMLPLGVFSTTITGTGFTAVSKAQLGNSILTVTSASANTLTVSGFAGTSGTSNLIVSNGPVQSQPLPVQVGVPNAQVSAAAARRFFEQAAFGPTPSEAAHVQQVGFQNWLNEQFTMAPVSNYNGVGTQGGMGTYFLTNAVSNPDQLRQRVAFALSQIFVTSINKLIWNAAMVPYQQMLVADAFTNYRQILYDVTLSPAMGQYLDMANNAKANPAAGIVANENYAREVLQLFSIGTKALNPDGSVQTDGNGLPLPNYSQFTITEFARAFTGWTYAPAPGHAVQWPTYVNQNGPMVPYAPMHDSGAKTLLNGYISPAGVSPQQDLNNAIDNIFNHPNVGPFFGKLLIQHLVKSNPSPAYIQRVAAAFADNGQGVRGDMQAVISAILLDPEARANDDGGNDQALDGHLQEPALFIAGMVRAFGGQMNNQNYYAYSLANLNQDIYNAPSVFNYYSPSFAAPGVTPEVLAPELQIDTPNNAIYRANLVAGLFSSWSNPVVTNGPGTTVDLTPFMPLATTPATLVDALDLTLTHGTMPASMKQTIVNAVTADTNGNLSRIQTGIYLIATSSYYNVWH